METEDTVGSFRPAARRLFQKDGIWRGPTGAPTNHVMEATTTLTYLRRWTAHAHLARALWNAGCELGLNIDDASKKKKKEAKNGRNHCELVSKLGIWLRKNELVVVHCSHHVTFCAQQARLLV